MRHLLTSILVVALLSSIFATCYTNSKSSTAAVADMTVENEEKEQKYYGDTLYWYDGKTIVYDYGFEWEERPSSLSTSAIITYQDTIPIDTCRVIGNGTWIVNGDCLDFAIGVDTVYYPFCNLSDSVDPERELVSAKFNVQRHDFHHTFELTDSSRTCDFSFVSYLPNGYQKWIDQFIATVMWNDIQAIFLDNKGSDRIINEYYGIKKSQRRFMVSMPIP